MKNLELIIVSVLNAAVPVCLYYMIIFYLFFTHTHSWQQEKQKNNREKNRYPFSVFQGLCYKFE